jgi:hypothetical protein
MRSSTWSHLPLRELRLIPLSSLLLLAACIGEPSTLEEFSRGNEPLDSPDSGFHNASDAGAVPDVDAGSCDDSQRCGSTGVCCAAEEECVDGVRCLPTCANERCGSSGVLCCDPEQGCLDGVVCAARCAADQSVCGSALELCCAADQVCLDDACIDPGLACRDDFDCLQSGLYCEPSIGKCLTTPTAASCEVRPDFDQISVSTEWHWPGVTVNGLLYENVWATPVVGDVTGDGMPDVVVPVYTGADVNDAVLVALDGATGVEHWVVSALADEPESRAAVALANFDADPALEIVYHLDAGGYRLLDGNGASELARRNSGTAMAGYQSPAVVDLDADGVPDVVVGCHALNGRDIADAAKDFFDAGDCENGGRSATAVANLDADPEPEITSGGVAYNLDGSVLWTAAVGTHGFPAVADLDANGTPEVINVVDGQILVLDGATGAVRLGPGGSWADATFGLPGGGTGGPPTVADFDGDGLAEVATAGQAFYAVYDPDCLPSPPRSGGSSCGATGFLRWQTPTQDLSSSVTGSSVFDFQGDGPAEVIYNDECFLHVYDGTTGAETLSKPVANSSRTDSEYPIVVDVDRDGNSEIVVPANRDSAVTRDNCPAAYAAAFGVDVASLPAEIASGTSGIYVLGDPGDKWVGTRPIWNQYTYHVSNVSELGEVPSVEADNWSTAGLNNYRQNVQGAGVFNAPNLTATLELAFVCLEGRVQLSAVVANQGSRGVPAGVSIELLQTAPGVETSVAELSTTGPILPGGEARLSASVEAIEAETSYQFLVRVDGKDAAGGVVSECLEDDNSASASGSCPKLRPD